MEEEYEEDVSPSKVNDAIYFFTRKPIDEGKRNIKQELKIEENSFKVES